METKPDRLYIDLTVVKLPVRGKAGVKLYGITTSLFLLNKAEINNVSLQTCCTVWPQPNTLVCSVAYDESWK